MKRILYLTFYFEPDLCAGSFRNTTLANSLAEELEENSCIDLITTFPNRYQTYKQDAPAFEDRGNLKIHRINVHEHKSGFLDQINSFWSFFKTARKLTKHKKYDVIFASSSRLFTAYLGYTIARKNKTPLYLDIRDIFVDTMENVLKNPIVKLGVIPFIKIIEKKTFNYASHINLISEGFSSYFQKFKCNSYSYYSNGIDDEFLNHPLWEKKKENPQRLIIYAGNIGEGQGLDKIVPLSAQLLGNNYKFLIIGDGGAKQKLKEEVLKLNIYNVELKDPVNREELKQIYTNADFLFLHLNNYEAFEKVLPSKIFELATYDKPIIAGVSGYAFQFIKNNIPNVILFKPCDVADFFSQMKDYHYKTMVRSEFINHYKRSRINKDMVQSIMKLMK